MKAIIFLDLEDNALYLILRIKREDVNKSSFFSSRFIINLIKLLQFYMWTETQIIVWHYANLYI